jgi:hypothetical protein
MINVHQPIDTRIHIQLRHYDFILVFGFYFDFLGWNLWLYQRSFTGLGSGTGPNKAQKMQFHLSFLISSPPTIGGPARALHLGISGTAQRNVLI